jgi:hypothetical protein
MRLVQADRLLLEAPLRRGAAGAVDVPDRPHIAGELPLLVSIHGPPTGTLLRLRIGAALVEPRRAPPEAWTWTGRDELGEVSWALEEAHPATPHDWSDSVRGVLEVVAPPDVVRLHGEIVRDLDRIHVGLAHETLGRTGATAGGRTGGARLFQPEHDIGQLALLDRELERALRTIGTQPSSGLVRNRVLTRWRAGDALDAHGLQRALHEGATDVTTTGRFRRIGKVWVRRSHLSQDVEEHRQIRDGLRRIAAAARALAQQCRHCAHLYGLERRRWARQVFDSRYRPRVELLEQIAFRAEETASRVAGYVAAHDFLREAGQPRGPLRPTPTFVGRPEYRAAYTALLRARRQLGLIVDGESLRMGFRKLSTLYEYWCFLEVVEICGLVTGVGGAAESRGAYRLIHDVYRPELAPGQSFTFRLPHGARLVVTYEPDFEPVDWTTGGTYRAALVTGPLRPDVTLALAGDGRPHVIMAIDAKSTRTFTVDRLWEVSDYRALIHDPVTGHQPVRQVFLAHLDERAAPVCNVAGYLAGRSGTAHTSVIGAMPFLPGRSDHVERAIERFLEVNGALPGDGGTVSGRPIDPGAAGSISAPP